MARGESSSLERPTDEAQVAADVVARADALLTRFPECFWFWHPEARIRTRDDVRLVIRHLREYGDREAWLAARALNQCLSPDSRSAF